jgi:hypothetical protein
MKYSLWVKSFKYSNDVTHWGYVWPVVLTQNQFIVMGLCVAATFHSIVAGSQQSRGPTDQVLLIHCSAKNVLTIRHVISITTFFIRMYRTGRRLSSFKLSCNLFGIIPVVYSSLLVVLYRPCSVAILLYALLSSLCTSAASRCWWCEGRDCYQFLHLFSFLLLLLLFILLLFE